MLKQSANLYTVLSTDTAESPGVRVLRAVNLSPVPGLTATVSNNDVDEVVACIGSLSLLIRYRFIVQLYLVINWLCASSFGAVTRSFSNKICSTSFSLLRGLKHGTVGLSVVSTLACESVSS